MGTGRKAWLSLDVDGDAMSTRTPTTGPLVRTPETLAAARRLRQEERDRLTAEWEAWWRSLEGTPGYVEGGRGHA